MKISLLRRLVSTDSNVPSSKWSEHDCLTYLPITRRTLLFTGLTYTASIASATPSILFSNQFEYHRRLDSFGISSKYGSWKISISDFGSKATLSVVETSNSIIIKVINGKFPGTNTTLDFTFLISEHLSSAAEITCRSSVLGIVDKMPLADWLSGLRPFWGKDKTITLVGHKNTDVNFVGSLTSLHRDWTFYFSDSATVNLDQVEEYRSTWISLNHFIDEMGSRVPSTCVHSSGNVPSVIEKILCCTKGGTLSLKEEQRLYLELHLSDNSLPIMFIEAAEPTIPIFLEMELRNSEQLKLYLGNCRIAITFDPNSKNIEAAGTLSNEGSSMVAGNARFEIKSYRNDEVCYIEFSEDKKPSLDHTFTVYRSNLPIVDAVSLYGSTSVEHRIHINGREPLKPSSIDTKFVSSSQKEESTSTAAVVSEIACHGCQISGKPAGIKYFATRLVRSKDLMDVTFEFYNFELKESGRSESYLIPRDVPGPCVVIVTFPPQHIAEEAFAEAMGCDGESSAPRYIPIGSSIASKSRLVFEYPRELGELDLRTNSLFAWENWKQKNSPAERHPNLIASPKWDETAIEVPSNIIMQPAPETYWRVKKLEGESDRYVLFHTELLPLDPFDPNEHDFRRRARMIPVWTSAFSECGVDTKVKGKTFFDYICRKVGLENLGSKIVGGCKLELPPLKTDDGSPREVLSKNDMREIVRLSHDITLCPVPPKVDHSLLTPLGAWFYCDGYWPKNKPRSVYSNLQKWRRKITQGRDQLDHIVRRGFLYPFGHRIALVEDTNREEHMVGGSYYAVLKKKWYVVVEQKEVHIDPARVLESKSDLTYKMCFRKIRILETRSSDLDPSTATPSNIPGQVGSSCNSFFYGTACGSQYYFQVIATDWRGREVKFSVPLIFISDLNVSGSEIPALIEAINKDIYFSKIPAERDLAYSFSDLSGQVVALAPGYQEGDTDFEVSAIRFKGEGQRLPVEFDVEDLPDYIDAREERCVAIIGKETEISAPFYPIVEALEARAPTLSKGTPDGGGSCWLEIVDPSITQETFEIVVILHSKATKDLTNKPIDLNAESYPPGKFQLPFHQNNDSSGGVSGPTPDITAWSRIKGPLGVDTSPFIVSSSEAEQQEINAAAAMLSKGNLDPSTYFSTEAKILGVIPLSTILGEMDLGSSTPAFLDFYNIGGDVADSTGFVYEWDTTYRKIDLGILKFEPTATDGNDSSKITISGGVFLEVIDKPRPTGFVSGNISQFSVSLIVAGNGIRADFNQIGLYASIGEKIKFDVDIAEVQFVGPIMEFIQKLKESFGFGDGFDVVLKSDSVSAIMGPFELPGISFGVFSLSGISFSAACDIYFKGNKPILFTFAFANQARPFTLAVAFMGGRGYFLFAVDTSGVQNIAAGLEFGATAEFVFGGFAHGNIYFMGGVFYNSRREHVQRPCKDSSGKEVLVDASETIITVQIYIRAGGNLRCFGFITVSLDVHLGLSLTKRGNQSVAYGTATLTFSVKVGFFKKSFSVNFTKEIPGSSSGESAQGLVQSARSIQQRSLSPASPASTRSSYIAVFEGRHENDVSEEEVNYGLEKAILLNDDNQIDSNNHEYVFGMSRQQFRYYWYAYEENRRYRF